MTTSTPTNEGVAIAATVIAQAKGDVPSARRVLGDAHRWTCTIDPSFKPDDKDKRIADLEAQVHDLHAEPDADANAKVADATKLVATATRELGIVEGERNDAKAKVAALTEVNANLARSVDDLTRRVVKIESERDSAIAAVETEGELVGELQRELAAVKAELAQVRAVNFDAPRKADAPATVQIVEPVAPVVVEPAAPAPAPVSNDPVRPSNVSEGAWASMSPMMRSFAAKRAATVS